MRDAVGHLEYILRFNKPQMAILEHLGEKKRNTVVPFVDFYFAFWYLTAHSSSARGSAAYKSAWSSSLEVCDLDKRDSSLFGFYFSDIIIF